MTILSTLLPTYSLYKKPDSTAYDVSKDAFIKDKLGEMKFKSVEIQWTILMDSFARMVPESAKKNFQVFKLNRLKETYVSRSEGIGTY